MAYRNNGQNRRFYFIREAKPGDPSSAFKSCAICGRMKATSFAG
jgi:hypothetical protein